MHFHKFLFAIFAIVLFSGCSSKSKGFFEDLYSQTEVRSATQEDYSSIKADENTPILTETPKEKEIRLQEKLNNNYTSEASQVYHGTGKIIDVDYDNDVNLFVYAFLKSGTSNPISFYYDKDLRPIGKIVTITIKDNFLTSISGGNVEKTQRTSKKRKWSKIKVPTIEKINTL